MAITLDSPGASGIITPEEQTRVDEMNRNLRQTGSTSPAFHQKAQPEIWWKNLFRFGKTKSPERG